MCRIICAEISHVSFFNRFVTSTLTFKSMDETEKRILEKNNIRDPVKGRCGFFVKRKQRYCKMLPAKGNTHCAEHLQFDTGTKVLNTVSCFYYFNKAFVHLFIVHYIFIEITSFSISFRFRHDILNFELFVTSGSALRL